MWAKLDMRILQRLALKTHKNPVKFFMVNSHVLMANFHGFFTEKYINMNMA